MRRFLTITLGAILVIAAVAGFVIIPEHAPSTFTFGSLGPGCAPGNSGCVVVYHGLSRTMYDLLRIATWAALIVGALLVILGVIAYARRPVRSPG